MKGNMSYDLIILSKEGWTSNIFPGFQKNLNWKLNKTENNKTGKPKNTHTYIYIYQDREPYID